MLYFEIWKYFSYSCFNSISRGFATNNYYTIHNAKKEYFFKDLEKAYNPEYYKI